MKKCPYCAESIQDEAIVCRFCGRELVGNVEKIAQARQNAAESAPLDIYQLLKRLGESYPTVPVQLVNEAFAMSKSCVTSAMKDIMVEYFKRTVIPKKDLDARLTQTINYSLAWSSVCFGVGVEQGAKHIQLEVVSKCLLALTEMNSLNICTWLTTLRENGWIKPKRSEELTRHVVGTVTPISFKLGLLGLQNFALVEPRKEVVSPSPFLQAITRLHSPFA